MASDSSALTTNDRPKQTEGLTNHVGEDSRAKLPCCPRRVEARGCALEETTPCPLIGLAEPLLADIHDPGSTAIHRVKTTQVNISDLKPLRVPPEN